MNQLPVQELLQSFTFRNQGSGSLFKFNAGRIIKNETDIGSFKIKMEGQVNYITITTESFGSIQLRVQIEQPEPVIIELYQESEQQPFMVLTAL